MKIVMGEPIETDNNETSDISPIVLQLLIEECKSDVVPTCEICGKDHNTRDCKEGK